MGVDEDDILLTGNRVLVNRLPEMNTFMANSQQAVGPKTAEVGATFQAYLLSLL